MVYAIASTASTAWISILVSVFGIIMATLTAGLVAWFSTNHAHRLTKEREQARLDHDRTEREAQADAQLRLSLVDWYADYCASVNALADLHQLHYTLARPSGVSEIPRDAIMDSNRKIHEIELSKVSIKTDLLRSLAKVKQRDPVLHRVSQATALYHAVAESKMDQQAIQDIVNRDKIQDSDPLYVKLKACKHWANDILKHVALEPGV